ncbi:hypothetical protein HYPP_02726 [Hyphomicrobium sp. ghe19]|nr:hypothetical protein HYPP_02726 [Hyphomicrobium sp. ghe19]
MKREPAFCYCSFAFDLTSPPSETSFGAMNGSTQDIHRLSRGVRHARPRVGVRSRVGQFVKALLAALILFAGVPISASHATTHCDGQKSHIAENAVKSVDVRAQNSSDTNTSPLGGIEDHPCSCPCLLQALPTRSCHKPAYFAGTRVSYAAYFDTLGASCEPDPLQKPPRFGISA